MDNTYAHVQPQAREIEQAVLGALMIDKDAYAVVCEMLYPESFYEPRNQKVFTAIRDLSMKELPVDVWTVTEQLAKQGDLEDVGGPGYVTELSSRVASSANIEYHARIIAQKSLARQLISFASVIETKAFDETVDVDELISDLTLNKLNLIFQSVLKREKSRVDPVRSRFGEIKKEEVSLEEKMDEILSFARVHKTFSFRELLERQSSRVQIVVTFLVILEMMKAGEIHIMQEKIFDDIRIESRIAA